MMMPILAEPEITSAVLPRKRAPLSDENAARCEISGLDKRFRRMTSNGANTVTAMAPLIEDAMTHHKCIWDRLQ